MTSPSRPTAAQAAMLLRSEQLFYFDSEYVLQVLSQLNSINDNGDQRWLLALRSLDRLLNDFGMIPESKVEFLKALRDNFGRELNATKSTELQLDKKYRSKVKEIGSALSENPSNEELFVEADRFLQMRSERNQQIIPKIKEYCVKNPENLSLADLIGSYVHMHINRIFRGNQRQVEFMLYDFLYRFHKSALARLKNSGVARVNEDVVSGKG